MVKAYRESSPQSIHLSVGELRRQTQDIVELSLAELNCSIQDLTIKRYIASGYLQERAAIKMADVLRLRVRATPPEGKKPSPQQQKAHARARELEHDANQCIALALRVHPTDLVEDVLNPNQSNHSLQESKALQLGRVISGVERSTEIGPEFFSQLREQTKSLLPQGQARRIGGRTNIAISA